MEKRVSNQQRIQIRISRSKARRRTKFQKHYSQYGDVDKVFTMQHYVEALKKCKRGVMWKGSVQRYCQHAIEKMYSTYNQVKHGRIPSLIGDSVILIYERGKARKIVPIVIDDRMTQRVACDYALTPTIRNSLIYANGASLSGKGVHFTRMEIERQLNEAIKTYGPNFYILTYDFKSYFDSVPHKTCLHVLRRYFTDDRLVHLFIGIILSYHMANIKKMPDGIEKRMAMKKLESYGAHGMCLGSQISQDMALVVPNKLDHYIKDTKRVRLYIRYMDDGTIQHGNKNYLKDLIMEMTEVAEWLGLHFNTNKTHITTSAKGFTFMKVHYRVKNGKVLKTLTRKGITRMRRKLKKFRKLVDANKMDKDNVYDSIQSYVSHSKIAKSYKSTKSIIKLYKSLFGNYKLDKLKKKL